MEAKSKKKIHRTKIFELNYYISIPLFAFYVAILNNFFDLDLWNRNSYFGGAIPAAGVSILFFFNWVSKYFNSNLRLRKFRPGMHTFPLKVRHTFIMGLLWPVRALWHLLWWPYSFLPRFTQEAPILGTALRIGYLMTANMVISSILPIPIFKGLLLFYGFGLTGDNLITWFLFVLPLYLSDLIIWINTELFCPPVRKRKKYER